MRGEGLSASRPMQRGALHRSRWHRVRWRRRWRGTPIHRACWARRGLSLAREATGQRGLRDRHVGMAGAQCALATLGNDAVHCLRLVRSALYLNTRSEVEDGVQRVGIVAREDLHVAFHRRLIKRFGLNVSFLVRQAYRQIVSRVGDVLRINLRLRRRIVHAAEHCLCVLPLTQLLVQLAQLAVASEYPFTFAQCDAVLLDHLLQPTKPRHRLLDVAMSGETNGEAVAALEAFGVGLPEEADAPLEHSLV
mmetsp:Transcript_119549/g.338347  ORF Transcript_119549/g.338347 Transcript_119549/m.338347 type:complete len:250 (+) Transcript_119549:260-1009(+)